MSHITLQQRYSISAMLALGYKQKDITEIIGKDKSVVSREIIRNCDSHSGEYRFDLAQRKYEKRMVDKPKKVVFTGKIEEYVNALLADKYSPEQIVGVSRREGKICVSHERDVLGADHNIGDSLFA